MVQMYGLIRQQLIPDFHLIPIGVTEKYKWRTWYKLSLTYNYSARVHNLLLETFDIAWRFQPEPEMCNPCRLTCWPACILFKHQNIITAGCSQLKKPLMQVHHFHSKNLLVELQCPMHVIYRNGHMCQTICCHKFYFVRFRVNLLHVMHLAGLKLVPIRVVEEEIGNESIFDDLTHFDLPAK